MSQLLLNVGEAHKMARLQTHVLDGWKAALAHHVMGPGGRTERGLRGFSPGVARARQRHNPAAAAELLTATNLLLQSYTRGLHGAPGVSYSNIVYHLSYDLTIGGTRY